ncbi:class I SAM-dependent methyltransferase [Desulfobaculum sp. SPO524]|uniref:class I SAM-dependent methyltransferase n=1 Tax=Desulfobaculum sp. SPO524 TaxID=3378071 RepID=UPI00385487D5
MQFFDHEKKQIIYVKKAASKEYWDELWGGKFDLEKIVPSPLTSWVVQQTKKHITAGRVLEAGCGRSQNVYSLHRAGYDVVGVDFAPKVVSYVKKHSPNLDVRHADVRKLPFADEAFDVYWSIGVIEHFIEGYDKIITEMDRVLTQGGYAFITFPAMNRLRRLKARLGKYPEVSKATKEQLDNFYQFALEPNDVITILKNHSYSIVEKFYFDGTKGIKDEIPLLGSMLQVIYDGKKGWRYIKKAIDYTCSRHAGHCICLIAKKHK